MSVVVLIAKKSPNIQKQTETHKNRKKQAVTDSNGQKRTETDGGNKKDLKKEDERHAGGHCNLWTESA